VRQHAVRRKLQYRIRIDLGKGRQFLDRCFGQFAFGNVNKTAGSSEDGSVAVQGQLRIKLDPADLSIFSQKASFISAVFQTPFDKLDKDAPIVLPIFLGDVLEEKSAKGRLNFKSRDRDPRRIEECPVPK